MPPQKNRIKIISSNCYVLDDVDVGVDVDVVAVVVNDDDGDGDDDGDEDVTLPFLGFLGGAVLSVSRNE